MGDQKQIDWMADICGRWTAPHGPRGHCALTTLSNFPVAVASLAAAMVSRWRLTEATHGHGWNG